MIVQFELTNISQYLESIITLLIVVRNSVEKLENEAGETKHEASKALTIMINSINKLID